MGGKFTKPNGRVFFGNQLLLLLEDSIIFHNNIPKVNLKVNVNTTTIIHEVFEVEALLFS